MSAVDGIDEFAAKLAGILKEKNAAYGDSFARVPTILAMLYPSVPPEVLENILFTARILDKLGRIAQDPLGAGEDAYLDTAGYAMMGANGQRLKREGKAKPGISVDSIYDEPGDGEAPSSAPAVVPASVWVIKRETEGGPLFLCTFDAGRPEWAPSEEHAVRYLSRRAADLALAEHLPAEPSAEDSPTVEEAKDGFEGSGRIKRDVWPFVVVHASATGWYLKHTGWGDKLFNTYGGGCWYSDERDATAFPSSEAAIAYLRRQAELNGAAPVGIPPAKVDANKGVPSVVRTGSVLGRPHTSHRVSDDGWVVCRNGRYLNCQGNAWELFPDWGTQFPTKVGAECAARQIDPETGKVGAKAASCE